MSKRTREREREIRGVLAELERSGESVQEFARRRGMSAWTIYEWRRRHRRGRVATKRAIAVNDQGFVAVSVKRPELRAGGFEVTVSGSTVVRVPTGFDDAELLRLVRVLRSC